jgi:hypothetical protein
MPGRRRSGSIRLAPWVRWGIVRRHLPRLVELLPTLGEELFVDLIALKGPQMQAQYAAQRQPNAVPLNYCIYQHDWDRRSLEPGEATVLHSLLQAPKEKALWP